MFFDEDSKKHEANKNIENFGFFTPNNTDYNLSLYEAIYERIYSRWKYHYILASGLLFLLSCNYPVFFAFFFFDVIIQWSMLRYGVDNFITQDSEYNMDQHDSQVDGGDSRVDPFVFLCYNNLGYIIYGVSEIGELICSEVYDYNNYLGFQNKISIYSCEIFKNEILSNNILVNNIDKNIDYDILNFRNKNNISWSDLNINRLNYTIINVNKSKVDLNYYFFNNEDLSSSYFDLKKNL